MTEDCSHFTKLTAFDLPEDGVIRKSPERGRGKVDLQAYLKQWQDEILKKEETIKDLPRINQAQFIQFSKTLYNLFHGDQDEELLYRAVAHVTSLLLRMEEVGRRLQEPNGVQEAIRSSESSPEGLQVNTESVSPESSSDNSSVQETAPNLQEVEWSFAFEQVLASLLNEPTVVSFFERPLDVTTRLDQAKVAQLRSSANK